MAKYITEYDGLPFMDKDGRDKIKTLESQYKDIANLKSKIEILEEDPKQEDLYEGRMWIYSPVTYKVTNNLTNCVSSNKDTSILKNNSYNATITPNSNYDLGTVIVTMGGVDITSTCVSNGIITITSVTGDIVITCTAVSNLKPCTGITLSANTLTFSTTDTQKLTATVTPSNTTDKIVWSVSPTGIANVNNGIVTPITNGSCVITATCGSKSATCSVTVSKPQEVRRNFTVEKNGVTNNMEVTEFNGSAWDSINECYSFTGDSKYIETDFSPTNAMSFVITLKDKNDGNNTVILEQDNYSCGLTLQSDKLNDGTKIVGARYGTGNFEVGSYNRHIIKNISDGQKHIIVIILDQTTDSFTGYIDDVSSKVSETGSNASINLSSISKIILGSRSGNYGTKADIYSLKLYDRVLSDSECENILNSFTN